MLLIDYWFVCLLLLGAGTLFLWPNIPLGLPRRLALLSAFLLILAAILSMIYGDPVRGPYARMTKPHFRNSFQLHAGENVSFPLRPLKDGIDFTESIQIPGRPVELWMRRRWWSGWNYRIAIREANGHATVRVTEKGKEELPPGWDVNADDTAVEVVDESWNVRLQVVQTGDYDVYVKTILSGPTQTLVMKDNRAVYKFNANLTEEDLIERIFQYPSYQFAGRRR